jgi:hypothetical protein
VRAGPVLRDKAASTLQKYWRRQLAMRRLASLKVEAAAAAAQREEERRRAATVVLQVGGGEADFRDLHDDVAMHMQKTTCVKGYDPYYCHHACRLHGAATVPRRSLLCGDCCTMSLSSMRHWWRAGWQHDKTRQLWSFRLLGGQGLHVCSSGRLWQQQCACSPTGVWHVLGRPSCSSGLQQCCSRG